MASRAARGHDTWAGVANVVRRPRAIVHPLKKVEMIKRSCGRRRNLEDDPLEARTILMASPNMIVFLFGDGSHYQMISRETIASYPESFFFKVMMKHIPIPVTSSKKHGGDDYTDDEDKGKDKKVEVVVATAAAAAATKTEGKEEKATLATEKETKTKSTIELSSSSSTPEKIQPEHHPVSSLLKIVRDEIEISCIHVDGPPCEFLFRYMQTRRLPNPYKNIANGSNVFQERYNVARLYNLTEYMVARNRLGQACRTCHIPELQYKSDIFHNRPLIPCNKDTGHRTHLHIGSRIDVLRQHTYYVGGGDDGAGGQAPQHEEMIIVGWRGEESQPIVARRMNGTITPVTPTDILNVIECGWSGSKCNMRHGDQCPPVHIWVPNSVLEPILQEVLCAKSPNLTYIA